MQHSKQRNNVISMPKVHMASYIEFCAIIRRENIGTLSEYDSFVRSENPDAKTLPKQPQVHYKKDGYTTFDLAAGIAGNVYDGISISEAKELAKIHDLKSPTEWRAAVIKGLFDAPLHPSKIPGFSNNKNFFGINKSNDFCTDLLEAAKIARTIGGLFTSRDWVNLCSKGKRPKSLPSNPSVYYRKQWFELKKVYNLPATYSFWQFFFSEQDSKISEASKDLQFSTSDSLRAPHR